MSAVSRSSRLILLVALLTAWAASADAHPAPFSYLDLNLDASKLHGTLVIHDFDAAHELGLDKPAMLLDPEVAVRYRDRLVAIIQTRLRVSADGRALTPTWGVIDVLPDRQSVRLPLDFGAETPGAVTIDTVMFPYDPNHQTFINIYEKGQLRHQAVLDAANAKLNYYAGTTQGKLAVVRTFVASGIHHILIGPDHILFLFGLLLLGGSLTRLAGIVTAFTLGHSVTLSLAALDLVTPATSLVEPAIALSIVIVGVDNLLVSAQKKPAEAEAGGKAPRDLRAWLAAVFGLIHGFGFASVLKEFGLPREALGWSLFSFNLGVEIGQLIIVIAFASLLALVRQRNASLGERLAWAGSVVVVIAGGYWFVQRVWFTGA